MTADAGASTTLTGSSAVTFFEQRFHGDEPPRTADVRDPYERDRARVIHSSGFRRLQGKTQVMGVGEGDFHRTRLTHSIECAQIGTGLLDQLNRAGVVPPDVRAWMPPRTLIEAACFSHDLGHPPFGHGGEQALFGQMRMLGGFEGNAQTLRLMTRLEKYKAIGWGVNPTRRLILSVLKYPAAYSSFDYASVETFPWKPPKCYFDEESDIVSWAVAGFPPSDLATLPSLDVDGKPANRTFDCSMMELADDIAYGIHDIEDIVARRLADREQLHEALKKSFDVVGGRLETHEGPLDATVVLEGLFADSFQRKRTIGRLVNTFVTSVRIVENSTFEHPLLRYRVGLGTQHSALLEKFKKMSFRLVIHKAPVQQLERRGMRVITDLFRALRESPSQLIPSWNEGHVAENVDRGVCDYIAGMTDSYAEKVYRRLFVPGIGSSSDEL